MLREEFYDDPHFDYRRYWNGRLYEHLSEVIAIKKLIEQIPTSRRNNLLEVGAGFGRIAKIYSPLFKECVLLEPSNKLINQARNYLSHRKNLSFCQGKAENLPFDDSCFDLVLMIRILHHLIRPGKVFQEVNRVLKPKGFLILEMANKAHIKARMVAWMRRKALDKNPVDIRSRNNLIKKTIPFINYHPDWIENLLEEHGFRIRSKLSVSNFRHSLIKRIFPLRLLLYLEDRLQLKLAPYNFGPSVFFLAQKTDT